MLLVFNRSASPVTLAGFSVVVPPSTAAPARGPGVDVTSELRGRSGGEYAALEAQRLLGALDYLWTSYVEYDTATLLIEVQGKSPRFAKKTAWFINQTTGSKNNTGDAGDPMDSWESVEKLIDGQEIDQATTVTFVTDVTKAHIHAKLGLSGSLLFQTSKALTTLYTGALTGGTAAINRAGNLPQIIEDTALPTDWATAGAVNSPTTAPVWVRLTSGTLNTAKAWIDQQNPNGGGVKTASCSPFIVTGSALPNAVVTPWNNTNPLSGDTFVVETGLCMIDDFTADFELPSLLAGSIPPGNERVAFHGFDLRTWNNVGRRPTVRHNSAYTANNPPVGFFDCDVGKFGPLGGLCTFVNCRFTGQAPQAASMMSFGGFNTRGGLFIGHNVLVEPGAQRPGFDQDTLFSQGARLRVRTAVLVGSICIRNWTGIATDNTVDGRGGLIIMPGGVVDCRASFSGGVGNVSAIYGSSAVANTLGVDVRPGGTLAYSNDGVNQIKPTLTGAAGDVRCGGVVTSWSSFGNDLGSDLKNATISRNA